MVAMYPTMPLPGTEPVIVAIGEIQVTSATILTPAGAFPLRGSQWHATDQWFVTQRIPQWAIVMTIVGFFCLTVFSLFFLLAKEDVYSGSVTVTVQSGSGTYVARVPVNSQQQLQYLYSQINYARSLALV